LVIKNGWTSLSQMLLMPGLIFSLFFSVLRRPFCNHRCGPLLPRTLYRVERPTRLPMERGRGI
jgi:hypothetical protein